MGCDIHTFAEVMMQGKWQKIEEDVFPEYADIKTSSPFNWRSYSMFAFLAGVRNYDHCVPISDPKGLPEDSEYLNSYIMPYKDKEYSPNSAIPMKTVLKNIYQNPYYHSLSYLTLEELLSFDYEKTF